ncbi:MAG: hypothetical protein HOD11_08035 [Candidatus Marinimicrobia bacterium]|nr:hypothetical protein [Candidatus Neomarinimicrobiota bacterium]
MTKMLDNMKDQEQMSFTDFVRINDYVIVPKEECSNCGNTDGNIYNIASPTENIKEWGHTCGECGSYFATEYEVIE